MEIARMAFEGRLQQWNDQRGFGFIEVEATRERVFVHAGALPGDGTRPATGARARQRRGWSPALATLAIDNAPRRAFSREETMNQQRGAPLRATTPAGLVAPHRCR